MGRSVTTFFSLDFMCRRGFSFRSYNHVEPTLRNMAEFLCISYLEMVEIATDLGELRFPRGLLRAEKMLRGRISYQIAQHCLKFYRRQTPHSLVLLSYFFGKYLYRQKNIRTI